MRNIISLTLFALVLAWLPYPSPADSGAAPGVATPGVAPPGVATPGVATPGVATPGPSSGMKLISLGSSAYVSSGTSSRAYQSTHNDSWRSSGLPAALAYDLSSVPAANRRQIYLVWYNDPTYGYDHTLGGAPGYNNPGSYTIDANAAPGGRLPTSGWVTLESVVGNTLHSRDSLLPFAGYNWVRINASAADGSPGNSDIVLNLDVYDASGGVTDGWLFAGDSITASGMGHNDLSVHAESFTNQVGALTGIYPPQQNAGVGGWSTGDMISHLPRWLQSFHGKYVTLSLGTNDAAGSVPPGTFHDNMAALIKQVLAAGKIPVLPTIPWSRDPTHARNIPALNAQIQKLYRAFPAVIPGPDLYAYLEANQGYISADNVHPTQAGYAAVRTQWASVVSKSIYGLK
jgi:lysophospholipase L1-like esterase